MNRYCLLTVLVTATTMSIGLAWGQQSSAPPTGKSDDSIKFESLITLDPDSPMPFMVNEALAADLIEADEELAAQALGRIKQDMTELVTRYPKSPAANEVNGLLDKAGLKVIPGHGVYAKHVFCISIPITR